MGGPGLSDDKIRREAERIFDDIQDERLVLPDGETGWVGYDTTDGRLVVKGRKGLYSGQLGIALYFAAMYEVFRSESYRRAVYEAVEYLLEADAEELIEDAGLGGGSGFGSLVYGLAVLSELTGEQRYRNRAHRLVQALTEEAIKADDGYDVLLGASGAVAGLLGLYERTGEEATLEKAVECGEHLLANRYEKWGYRVWDTHWSDNVQSFSTGMGHGAAGIGYSLYRLYAHTQQETFREAADDAIQFENVFYSEREANWKANWTAIPHYPNWWCYGLAGIGLARLGSREYHDSAVLRRDLDRASDFDPQLGASDSLCHGTFSQVDLLVELGRSLDETRMDAARDLAASAIERRQRSGAYRVACGDVDGIHNPILFLGTAGIGYTLLRVLQPDAIPSVLRFE